MDDEEQLLISNLAAATCGTVANIPLSFPPEMNQFDSWCKQRRRSNKLASPYKVTRPVVGFFGAAAAVIRAVRCRDQLLHTLRLPFQLLGSSLVLPWPACLIDDRPHTLDTFPHSYVESLHKLKCISLKPFPYGTWSASKDVQVLRIRKGWTFRIRSGTNAKGFNETQRLWMKLMNIFGSCAIIFSCTLQSSGIDERNADLFIFWRALVRNVPHWCQHRPKTCSTLFFALDGSSELQVN